MIYRAIGLMSGSSLDGLDIAFAEFEEIKGVWNFDIKYAETISYNDELRNRLKNASDLSARQFIRLDNEYGRFTGKEVVSFIERNRLHHQVQIIASHGHTVFHSPEEFITTQIGNGAQIAALTNINVVSDLRSMDVALGGQGAPLVTLGEKLLFKEYNYFLNIGGIANLTVKTKDENFLSFDICAANQVLNYFAEQAGKKYDNNGNIALSGNINRALLNELNDIHYYQKDAPKSLSNQFFSNIVLPIITSYNLNIEDVLRTYTEHVAMQITNAVIKFYEPEVQQLFISGGGAYNNFLVERIGANISSYNIQTYIPEKKIIEYKEALVMAFLGTMRWREENTVLPKTTGALRPSIGGAVWIGQEY